MPVETHVGPDPGKKCHKCRKVNLSGSKHVFPTHGKLADIALRDPAMPIRFELGAAGAAGNLLRDHRAAASYRVERSEEHTSELQSLMRISYAVFCLKKNKYTYHTSISIPKCQHT